MSYVEKLKELREDNDYTQKDIAKILNKSQQGYAHLENGKARFTIEDLQRLCMFYNISADYILGLPQGLEYPKR